MKNSVYFIFIFLNFCTSQEYKINGISFVASDKIVSEDDVNAILKMNANWVTLMPFAFMRNINDSNIIFEHKSQRINEKEKGIEHSALLFKKQKRKIMLKPQIWIPNGGFTGHVEMKNEKDWQTLEKNYEKFILHFASIAQDLNCELFCIGTELNVFVSKRQVYWQKLIPKIRSVYKGKITYAENWDTYKKVSFLSELDYIGIDAYFPLDSSKTASIEQLEKAWLPIKMDIKALSDNYDKKIIFTEYGYQSKDFTTKEPWNFSENNSVNLEAQSNALQALYNVFWDENWFAGGFLWKWFDDHKNVGGLNDNDYTVQNKPSENIVKNLFTKSK